MIGTVFGEVGKTVSIKGIAGDYGRAICAIEFSLDDGEHWTRYEIEEREPGLNTYWTFVYTPERAGTYRMLVRSVNNRGEASPEPSVVPLSIS